MRGEFIAVWGDVWREIWARLSRAQTFPADLFCDIYRDLVPPPAPPLEPLIRHALSEDGRISDAHDRHALQHYQNALDRYHKAQAAYQDAITDAAAARNAFRAWLKYDVKSEAAAIAVLERAYTVLSAYGDDALCNRYFTLVEAFLRKYSLGYDLRRPFGLCPTLPGLFAKMMRDLKTAARRDEVLHGLLLDYEDAFRGLGPDYAPGRIKTCIQKQVNLMEALGRRASLGDPSTLSEVADQLHNWPHRSVKDALKSLYGFACDYPGIRHGGRGEHQLRPIDRQDLLAVSIALAGFTPYLHPLEEDS